MRFSEKLGWTELAFELTFLIVNVYHVGMKLRLDVERCFAELAFNEACDGIFDIQGHIIWMSKLVSWFSESPPS